MRWLSSLVQLEEYTLLLIQRWICAIVLTQMPLLCF